MHMNVHYRVSIIKPFSNFVCTILQFGTNILTKFCKLQPDSLVLSSNIHNFPCVLKKISVKKGTLPLRWVSSPGPFDCRSNALSSELRNLFTPIWLRIYHELFTNFSKSFQSIMSIIRKVYHSDDRAFDRQSEGTGLDTQRSGSVPFFTEKFFKIYIENSI